MTNKKRLLLIITIFLSIISFISLSHYYNFSIWQIILELQRSTNQIIITYVKELKTNGYNSSIIFWLFIYSFAYGTIHAIGPGHGKLLLSTNLLTKEKGFIVAIVTAIIASITHIGNAIILAFLIKYIFTGIGHFARMNMTLYFSKINGGLIILLGIILLIVTITNKFNFHKYLHKVKNDKLVGVLAGLVPCPVSMSIILISISYSIIYAGLISVGGIVLGIFFTLLLVELFTIIFKDQLIVILEKYQLKGEKISKYIVIFQGIMFIFLGFMLFH